MAVKKFAKYQDADGTEYMEPIEDSIDTPNVELDSSNNTLVGETIGEFLNRMYGKTVSEKLTYSGVDVDYVEYFSTSSQITANRLAKVELTLDSELDLTTETIYLYSTDDGTTVLKTITRSMTYSDHNLTNTEQVTT